MLTMPSGFPDSALHEIKNRVITRMKNPSPELDNLLGAENGVRYRLRACADYSADFTRSLKDFGDNPPMPERYNQERLLFGFFVSGLAVFDSFSFFIYFAAAQLKPQCFPTQTPRHLRSITCKNTEKAFSSEFPDEPLTKALQSLIAAKDFEEWEKYRNILAHRAAPGRNIYASIGTLSSDPAPDWKIEAKGAIKIDANLTGTRLAWLLTAVNNLISTADNFTQKHFIS